MNRYPRGKLEYRVFDNLVDSQQDAILPIINQAIGSLSDVQSMKIKVHPDFFKTVSH